MSSHPPLPQLFDFATIDKQPSHLYGSASFAVPSNGRSVSTSTVPASLPDRVYMSSRTPQINLSSGDDTELDVAFDGDEEDDEEVDSGRSGSADMDVDMGEDEEDEETKDELSKLALGSGSGGLKGRRKGMVFKCENCSKVRPRIQLFNVR